MLRSLEQGKKNREIYREKWDFLKTRNFIKEFLNEIFEKSEKCPGGEIFENFEFRLELRICWNVARIFKTKSVS